MFFNKEKMYMGSFIRGITSEIIALQPYTFAEYLENDPNEVLSQEEFEAFNEQLPLLRNLLMFALMLEATNNGKITYSSLDLGMTFVKAFALAAEDNNHCSDEVTRMHDNLLSEMNEFVGYMGGPSEEDFANRGFVVNMCMYFTTRFSSLPFDVDKQGTYVVLLNNQKRLMTSYFEKTLKKVKIIG